MDHQHFDLSKPHQNSAKVALLVDGDNIAAHWAGKLLVRAASLGQVVVKRVYCNLHHFRNWESSAGFGLQIARAGSNAADMLLTIDAVDLAHRRDLSSIVIASSDGGYAPLARYLVERGLTVLGLGLATAPSDWRKSCSRFEALVRPSSTESPSEPSRSIHELSQAAKVMDSEAAKPSSTLRVTPVAESSPNIARQVIRLNEAITEVLRSADSEGMLLCTFADRMLERGIGKADLVERSWQKYFAARTDQFLLNPAVGPTARVRRNDA